MLKRGEWGGRGWDGCEDGEDGEGEAFEVEGVRTIFFLLRVVNTYEDECTARVSFAIA